MVCGRDTGWRMTYDTCMRYPGGGGLSAQVRIRRERVRQAQRNSGSCPGFRSGAGPWPGGIRLRDLHCTDHLLLVVLRVVAAVVRADECPVVDGTVEDVAEIVTDEGIRRDGRRCAIGGVELGVPGVAAQPDVVSDRGEIGPVELDAGVDAVIARPVGRQASGVIRVAAVESQPGRYRLLRAPGRAREPAVVEIDAHRAVRSHRQVGLELVDVGASVVVYLDRRRPVLALVVGGREQDVAEPG